MHLNFHYYQQMMKWMINQLIYRQPTQKHSSILRMCVHWQKIILDSLSLHPPYQILLMMLVDSHQILQIMFLIMDLLLRQLQVVGYYYLLLSSQTPPSPGRKEEEKQEEEKLRTFVVLRCCCCDGILKNMIRKGTDKLPQFTHLQILMIRLYCTVYSSNTPFSSFFSYFSKTYKITINWFWFIFFFITTSFF